MGVPVVAVYGIVKDVAPAHIAGLVLFIKVGAADPPSVIDHNLLVIKLCLAVAPAQYLLLPP